MARYTGVGVLGILLVLGGCGGEEVHNDFESLSQALRDARPGDTVRVGAVRITASRTLEVPGGVTLQGAGAGTTVVVAPSDSVGITARANTSVQTRVTDLSVESGGTAGVVAFGDGSAMLDNVEISTTRGIALGAQAMDVLVLVDVTMSGPVTPDNADAMPLNPAPNDTGTHGLVVVNVGDADLTRVRTDGFASFGGVFVNSDVAWADGGADGNLGTGVMASGGTTAFQNITVCGMLQGLRLIPPYATVFANGTTAQSTDLTVCDSDGVGMFHAEAMGQHANLNASGNAYAAVWIQNNDLFELTGAGSMIADNTFAGIIATGASRNVTIRDATVRDTNSAVRLAGETGTVEVGDGIQVVRGTTGVQVASVALVDNERAGFLLDLNGGSSDVFTATDTTASGTGASYGALAQNGTVMPGWDSGITRSGAPSMNDTAFLAGASTLAITDVVAPTDLPTAASLETMGLEAVGVVAPTD